VVVKKNVPIAERFFCHKTYTAILFSEHCYDNRYKTGKPAKPAAGQLDCENFEGYGGWLLKMIGREQKVV
jgi:hypothetical protein